MNDEVQERHMSERIETVQDMRDSKDAEISRLVTELERIQHEVEAITYQRDVAFNMRDAHCDDLKAVELLREQDLLELGKAQVRIVVAENKTAEQQSRLERVRALAESAWSTCNTPEAFAEALKEIMKASVVEAESTIVDTD